MRSLRILLEGNDDQRFIDNVIRPYISQIKPSMILTIKYAEERKVDVDKTIQKLDAKIAQAKVTGNRALLAKLDFERRRKINVLEYGADIRDYFEKRGFNRGF